MATFPSFDSSLSHSHSRPHPTRPNLDSFATTFNQDDYDTPPPGVHHDDWVRLNQQQRRRDAGEDEGNTEDSLLDEAPTPGGGWSGGESYDEEQQRGQLQHPRTRTISSSTRPRSRTSSSSTARNLPSSASPATHSPSPYDTTADAADEQSVSTDVDQTQTTELLSRRLAGPNGEDTTVDESTTSSIYGGGAAAGRPAKKRSSGGVGQNMTLREQEKVIDELKKDNFSLKLKLHFYEQRLEKMAPSSVEQALRENIQLKVEFQTLRTELKKYKKLLLEGDKAIQGLTRERDEAERAARGKGGAASSASARERELERELKRLREADREREEWENKARELQREVKRLRAGQGNEELEDLRAENADLQRHLNDAQDELEELRPEVADLRRELADSADRSGMSERGGLAQENASLRTQLSAQLSMLELRNAEKGNLVVELEELKQDYAAIENELEIATRAGLRGRGVGGEGEGEEGRDELEKDLNAHRDRALSLSLELEDCRAQLDAKEREIEELIAEVDEWRGEVEGARRDAEDARRAEEEGRQLLDDKEADVEELSRRVEQLLQQVAEKEAELAAEEEEVEALTHDLQKLGAQIFELESEIESKDAEVDALRSDLAAVDKELEDKQVVHEQVIAALKEKLSTHKSNLSSLQIEHQSLSTSSAFLTSRVEDLALLNAKLEEAARADDEEKRRLQDEAEEIMSALRKEEEERDEDAEKWAREREELEADLKSAHLTLSTTRHLLSQRESDLDSLQSSLNALECSTRKHGETSSEERVALQLETERVRRDLARMERELEEFRREVEERERQGREAALRLATAQSENKDLASQLAAQTQLRLTVVDKHEAVTKTLQTTQLELSSSRDRLRSVEDQLTHGQRSLGKEGNQLREQLTERNSLLLTVYQYMERVAGKKSSSTPSSPSLEPRPFTTDSKSFAIFHAQLLDRLKQVAQIKMSFERRVGEVQGKFEGEIANLKRQTEARNKQLDRFEASIKTATEAQRQWRLRVQQKQSEVEAANSQVSDLQQQLTSLRRSSAALSSPDLSRSPRAGGGAPTSPPSSAAAETALTQRLLLATQRVQTLERRLSATQSQLKDAEDKLGEQRSKIGTAEGKWESRFRELEARCRGAEERVKRERQGAKERVGELMGTIKNLELQLGSAKRRDQQLDNVLRVQQQQQVRPSSAASTGSGKAL